MRTPGSSPLSPCWHRLALVLGLVLAGACGDEVPTAVDPEGPDAALVAPPQGQGGSQGPTATPIPFNPEPGPFVNVLSLADDDVSGPLPIGFSFTFFGNTYTSFYVSSNGFIGFGEPSTSGCCTGGILPSPEIPNNVIALGWTDLYPPGGGTISWEVRGSSGSRRLIVSYEQLPWFPEVGENRLTSQVILYEGRENLIEIHTGHLEAGNVWTQGIENADGTQAAFLDGRVSADFGLENDGVRFTSGRGTARGRSDQHRVLESVTGSAHVRVDGQLRTFSFNARRHDGGRVRGEWQRFNRALGAKDHGIVTCFTIRGSRAWIGGVARDGSEVRWRVVDNGQGRKNPPDQTSLQATGGPGLALFQCAETPDDLLLYPIRSGNIQVRADQRGGRSVGGTATSIPFDPEPGPFANELFLSDDETSGPLPIGFEFTFFGTTYTSFYVSSNGFIGFGAATSDGCCHGDVIPSPEAPNAIIALGWTDLFPPGGGSISWETRGPAGSRRLVVSFDQIPWCCEFGANRLTSQVILYEGRENLIEIHTDHLEAGNVWTQGIENADGTQAAFLDGRVSADFGLENDGVRFTTGRHRGSGRP